MKWMKGNMFAHMPWASMIFVTTNAVIKRDGCLVMGRGAAAQAARLWSSLARRAGGRIIHSMIKYGAITILRLKDERWAGIFQVKYHFKDPASLELIEHSCKGLAEIARLNPRRVIRLNYPGIGLGQLSKEQVQPILEKHLGEFDNVEIWSY